jgi:SulP family sulfate permease
MSIPSGGLGSSRSYRALSVGSHSSPRLIPGSCDSIDDASNTTQDLNYGSFRGRRENQTTNASGHREPTRSSVHLSYRGPLGMLEKSMNGRLDAITKCLQARLTMHSMREA